MKLKVPRGNGCTGRPSVYGQTHNVIDLHSGKTVGHPYKAARVQFGRPTDPKVGDFVVQRSVSREI